MARPAMRSSSTSESSFAVLAALVGCTSVSRIDVCARGDRDELAAALAGGQVEIVLRDQAGQVVRRSTSPADVASFDIDSTAGASRVEVTGLDAGGLPVAGGASPIGEAGACV